MDIIKLYIANWKQNVIVTSTGKNEEKRFSYYLIYRRLDHSTNPNLIGNSVFNHNDIIDNEIVTELNSFFRNNNITEFNSTLHEFKPWNDLAEITKARISKLAYGHDCADVTVNTINSYSLCRLKARINCLNFDDVDDSLNSIFPNILNLNVNGRLDNLVTETFMDRSSASQIIEDYYGER
jgi:hypothetical protein